MNDQRQFLENLGMVVGDRDPLLNTNFPGRYMVSEQKPPGQTTQDGSKGPWCIVGDDLSALIQEAFDFFSD